MGESRGHKTEVRHIQRNSPAIMEPNLIQRVSVVSSPSFVSTVLLWGEVPGTKCGHYSGSESKIQVLSGVGGSAVDW